MLSLQSSVSELPKFWAATFCPNPVFLSYERGNCHNSLLCMNSSRMYEIMALVQKYQILLNLSFNVFLIVFGRGKCCHSESSLHLQVQSWMSFSYPFWAHCVILPSWYKHCVLHLRLVQLKVPTGPWSSTDTIRRSWWKCNHKRVWILSWS